MAEKTERWSIHKQSGHCTHPIGLHAYIGTVGTVGTVGTSDFVPMLGPLSRSHFSSVDIAQPAWALTKEIEELFPGKYVIWGGFDRTHCQAPLKVLGQETHWIPDPSIRSNWGLMAMRSEAATQARCFLDLEWDFPTDSHSIIHRTGIGFRYSPDSFNRSWANMLRGFPAEPLIINLNHRIWRPMNWEDASHSLAAVGFRVLCAQSRWPPIAARTIRLRNIPAEELSLAF